MGCSSSSTQTLAQENRPGVKAEEANGETLLTHNGSVAEDNETISEQTQLPIQCSHLDEKGPGEAEPPAISSSDAVETPGAEAPAEEDATTSELIEISHTAEAESDLLTPAPELERTAAPEETSTAPEAAPGEPTTDQEPAPVELPTHVESISALEPTPVEPCPTVEPTLVELTPHVESSPALEPTPVEPCLIVEPTLVELASHIESIPAVEPTTVEPCPALEPTPVEPHSAVEPAVLELAEHIESTAALEPTPVEPTPSLGPTPVDPAPKEELTQPAPLEPAPAVPELTASETLPSAESAPAEDPSGPPEPAPVEPSPAPVVEEPSLTLGTEAVEESAIGAAAAAGAVLEDPQPAEESAAPAADGADQPRPTEA